MIALQHVGVEIENSRINKDVQEKGIFLPRGSMVVVDQLPTKWLNWEFLAKWSNWISEFRHPEAQVDNVHHPIRLPVDFESIRD